MSPLAHINRLDNLPTLMTDDTGAGSSRVSNFLWSPLSHQDYPHDAPRTAARGQYGDARRAPPCELVRGAHHRPHQQLSLWAGQRARSALSPPVSSIRIGAASHIGIPVLRLLYRSKIVLQPLSIAVARFGSPRKARAVCAILPLDEFYRLALPPSPSPCSA